MPHIQSIVSKKKQLRYVILYAIGLRKRPLNVVTSPFFPQSYTENVSSIRRLSRLGNRTCSVRNLLRYVIILAFTIEFNCRVRAVKPTLQLNNIFPCKIYSGFYQLHCTRCSNNNCLLPRKLHITR